MVWWLFQRPVQQNNSGCNFDPTSNQPAANVIVQYRNRMGGWSDAAYPVNNPWAISQAMNNVSCMYNAEHVRAIDEYGNIIDYL